MAVVRLMAGVFAPLSSNVAESPLKNARGTPLVESQFTLVAMSQRFETPSPVQVSGCGPVKLVVTTLIVPLVASVAVFHRRSDASDGRLDVVNAPAYGAPLKILKLS